MLGYFRWLMQNFKTLYRTLRSIRLSKSWQKLKTKYIQYKTVFQAFLRLFAALVGGIIGLIAVIAYTRNVILTLIAMFFFFSYLLYSLELLDQAIGDP